MIRQQYAEKKRLIQTGSLGVRDNGDIFDRNHFNLRNEIILRIS